MELKGALEIEERGGRGRGFVYCVRLACYPLLPYHITILETYLGQR